ncbi:6-chlorohydroxyquinol-1,2-dioxygenase [Nocardioides immobilis]|uniref:6-chlorohydroxyquinol-1,2-dioxygenase n=1 Tax=Nocardioides immobilis TaxID=2049295 RepID=A0A417Y8Z0_9ACTN|nr:dioxygenase [Nocardioides immobilis]RHW29189.1 6-chlorohydroxyquinol-1,2-dioxygenase [Nocardioides immobilis]
MDFNEHNATDAVVSSFTQASDPRLRAVMESLTRHLHGFVREIEPTQAEWVAAIDFLTSTGKMCDDTRQEFILLSDVLGVSMLVDAINNRKPTGVTESTVLGPFHVIESPPRQLGADIADVHAGKPRCVIRGTVRDLQGRPVPGSLVDVWQADDEGFYDVQRDDTPNPDLRGLFTTDAQGKYWFKTVLPSHYPVPHDGPVGHLLNRLGRHPYRPAHIHFIAGARGHSPVTTHLFLAGSPYLDDDTVFGVKASLIREVRTVDNVEDAELLEVASPFKAVDFDIVLDPATAGGVA